MSNDFISDLVQHPEISDYFFLYLKTGSWSGIQYTDDLLLTIV